MTFRERVDIKYLALTAPIVTPLTCTPLLCSWYMDCLVSEGTLHQEAVTAFKTKVQRKKIKFKVILKDFHGAEVLNVKLFPESIRMVFGYIKNDAEKRNLVGL